MTAETDGGISAAADANSSFKAIIAMQRLSDSPGIQAIAVATRSAGLFDQRYNVIVFTVNKSFYLPTAHDALQLFCSVLCVLFG